MTLKGGVAAFADLSDQMAETITLSFSARGLSAGPTLPITVGPGAAAKLVIQAEPTDQATAGSPFEGAPAVVEEDKYGNAEDGDSTTTVTAYLASGTGTLAGGTTVTLDDGVASFPALVEDKVGTFTLGFTGDGLTSPASTSFTVIPAGASLLVLQTPPSPEATAGVALNVQPVVDEEDQYGNIETGDDITTVTAQLTSAGGRIQGTTSVSVKGGVATFTDLADQTAEMVSLVFSGGGLTSAPTGTITVGPAAASQLVIATPPSTAATAGTAFPTQPVIEEKDNFGNLETGDDTTLVTAALASGTGPLQGTKAITLEGGVATFTDLADDMAETIALSFSGGGLSVGPSQPITVVPRPEPPSWSSRRSHRIRWRPAQHSAPRPRSSRKTNTETSRSATARRR